MKCDSKGGATMALGVCAGCGLVRFDIEARGGARDGQGVGGHLSDDALVSLAAQMLLIAHMRRHDSAVVTEFKKLRDELEEAMRRRGAG